MAGVYRLGVVSFLNARPLVAGLEGDARVQFHFDVPAALPRLLREGRVDAALVPVIDLLRGADALEPLSDGCIACEGPTLTVRVFSQIPPDQIRLMHADADSHTSVALAQVLWHALYGVRLDVAPQDLTGDSARAGTVLVIGDKVVQPRWRAYRYDLDLGQLWFNLTGLPFVFAVWVRRSGHPHARGANGWAELAALLCQARDRGVGSLEQIATAYGPAHGFSAELARHYLGHCLRYRLDARAIRGIEEFAQRCAALGLAPLARVNWPEELGLSQETVRRS